MNKQQQPTTDNTTDNTQLIHKLRSEYEELHKKCCKLYAFRHSLDVDQKMNFDMEALALMQRQLELMEAYRHNLYLRIRHLGRLSIEIKTEHDPNFDEVDPEQKAQALHHCGQDADDACCQARQCSTVDRDAAPAASSDDDISDAIQDLVGYQVVCAGDMSCDSCPHDHYGTPCVKLELVGGYYICLAPLPNSIITQ